jgi:hypothetical protein
MKISEVQQGKKYWKGKSVMNGRTRNKEVSGIAVYVLEVDTTKQQVLASLNGTPAEWFGMNAVARWRTEDPTKTKTNY